LEAEQKFRVLLVKIIRCFAINDAAHQQRAGDACCGEADNIHDAFRLIESNQPDIAIVDLA